MPAIFCTCCILHPFSQRQPVGIFVNHGVLYCLHFVLTVVLNIYEYCPNNCCHGWARAFRNNCLIFCVAAALLVLSANCTERWWSDDSCYFYLLTEFGKRSGCRRVSRSQPKVVCSWIRWSFTMFSLRLGLTKEFFIVVYYFATLRFASAFAPPTLGIGAVLFPLRNSVIVGISESINRRLDLQEASDFFVDAFWTSKVGGGARTLTAQQRRELEQSQRAEFNKRYGGARPRVAELLVLRNADEQIIACAGVEVDRIPSSALTGPATCNAPLMSNLAVSRQYRRRGLAEQMVQAVETTVRKEWGYTECYLYVEERNRAAIRLYEKLGYRRLWRDDNAKTLLPTASGYLENADTVILCMKKNLTENFLQRLFRWD